ncbi:MAG TPA: N-acetylglucosamine-6-phosphate deacetylase [Microbacteriaceae bacterium]|nr:N-acetylglucosamine-6-phosphate deacetylase [Microbacteriaceae bacterium]
MSPLAGEPFDLILHSAHKVDADGECADFWFAARGGRIVETGQGAGWRGKPASLVVDAHGDRLTPGFIDVHGHGGSGHAFDEEAGGIEAALAVHRAHGTTRSVLSLVASPLPETKAALSRIASLARHDPLILGSHLEGPYLAPARKGAHDPANLRTPSLAEAEDLFDAGGGTVRQITIAPELPHALEVIGRAHERGIVAAVGHTAADHAQALAGFDAGARLLTHTFNAMNGIHHRAPGPIVAALSRPGVTLELILDGVHVHPDVARLLFAGAPGRVTLITDAMAATGVGDGEYRLGSLDVTVKGGKAVLKGTDSIAGSTLTQDRALRLAIERVGLEPRAAVEALTLTPARVLGRADEFGRLAPGYAADAVLFDGAWSVRSVWAAGERIA